MLQPPPHERENERLRALEELRLLDTSPEAALGHCVALAAALCGTTKAAISLVDRERQWFKAIFGDLPAEARRDVSFCGHAVAHDDVLIVPDATKDPRFADNPFVLQGLRFYAGVPLHGGGGLPLGTLCVLHDAPLALTPSQLAQLRELADAIEVHLDLRLLALRLGAQVAAAPLVSPAAPEPSATAALVHDLRNPLTTVHAGASYLLQLEGLPDEVRQVAEDMLASADAARALLVDLLDASKHDTSRLRERFTPVDLAVLARRVLRAVRLLANARGQSLDFEDRAKDSVVHGDALLIERSLRNLLDNALKYAPERLPVTITLLETPDEALELRVADQGPTLSAEAGERAFAPYQRLETGSGVEGHGIGLAFCRRAMALHGGRAWVEPRPGGGNVFVLHLPRQPPASLR